MVSQAHNQQAQQVVEQKPVRVKRLNFASRGKKYKYLAAFARCGRNGKAARIAGVSEGAHYYWLKDDPVYAEDWGFARHLATVKLEDTLVYEGYEAEKKNPLLAMFVMKKLDPSYRDNFTVEHKHTHTLDAQEAVQEIGALLQRNPGLVSLMPVAQDMDVIDAEVLCEEGGGAPQEGG